MDGFFFLLLLLLLYFGCFRFLRSFGSFFRAFLIEVSFFFGGGNFLSGGLGLAGWVVHCCLYSCGLPFFSFSELSIGGWSGLEWAGLYFCVLFFLLCNCVLR